VKVGEIMTTGLVTVRPEMSLKDAIERMVRAEVTGLPVIDAAGTLVGIVTEADVISREAYSTVRHRALALLVDEIRLHHWVTKAAGSTVAEVMSRDVLTCSPGEEVNTVARRMLEHDVKRMPVVERGVLVGIVARRDVLSIFDRPDEAIAADVADALVHHPEIPDDHHVRFAVEGGIVTLSGDVRFGWDAPIVVGIVRGISGVIDVVNHLRRREPNPPSVPDRWVLGPW
jgi:CBS domain-containing protein